MAFDCSVIRRKNNQSQKAVDKCIKELFNGSGSERISVPLAAFVLSKSVDSLLSLIGLHSNAHSAWKHQIIQIANHTRPSADKSLQLPVTIDRLLEAASSEILSLTDDLGLI